MCLLVNQPKYHWYGPQLHRRKEIRALQRIRPAQMCIDPDQSTQLGHLTAMLSIFLFFFQILWYNITVSYKGLRVAIHTIPDIPAHLTLLCFDKWACLALADLRTDIFLWRLASEQEKRPSSFFQQHIIHHLKEDEMRRVNPGWQREWGTFLFQVVLIV